MDSIIFKKVGKNFKALINNKCRNLLFKGVISKTMIKLFKKNNITIQDNINYENEYIIFGNQKIDITDNEITAYLINRKNEQSIKRKQLREIKLNKKNVINEINNISINMGADLLNITNKNIEERNNIITDVIDGLINNTMSVINQKNRNNIISDIVNDIINNVITSVVEKEERQINKIFNIFNHQFYNLDGNKKTTGLYECIEEEENNKYIILTQQIKTGFGYKYIVNNNNHVKYLTKGLLKDNNNYFEVIAYNMKHVKLYLDIEERTTKDISIFYKKINHVIIFVKKFVKDYFNIMDIDDKDIIILSAHDNNKRSVHILFNSIVFNEYNENTTTFLKDVFIKESNIYSTDNNNIFKCDEIEHKNIIDKSVYSCTQNFRLFGQSKINKTNTLIHDTFLNKNIDYNNAYVRVLDHKYLNGVNIINDDVIKTHINNNLTIPQEINNKKEYNYIKNHKKEDITNYILSNTTLKEILNISDDEIIKLDYYKIILYCIPFGFGYYERKPIAMALSKCATKEDYELYFNTDVTLYNINQRFRLIDNNNDFINKYEYFKNYHNKTMYGLPLLLKYAKMRYPELFKRIKGDQFNFITKTLFNNNIKDINNKNIDVYDERYIKNTLYDTKYICMRAHMGTGKTTYIKNNILPNYKRILFLSCRQSYALFLSNSLTTDKITVYNYMDKPDNIYLVDKLVISLESLLKIEYLTYEEQQIMYEKMDTNESFKETNYNYDVVIIDESETILNNLSSITLNNRQLTINQRLRTYIKNSKLCICMDAFLSNRTLNYIKRFEDSTDNITYVLNKYQPDKTTNIILCNDEEEINNTLKNKVIQKENNYIPCSSKKQTFKLEQLIKNNGENNNIVINADMDDLEKKRILNDINTEFLPYKNIISTCTFQAGASFDNVTHFNNCFLYPAPSNHPRDSMQQLKRIRHLTNNNIYYIHPSKNTIKVNNLEYTPLYYKVDNFYESIKYINNQYMDFCKKNGDELYTNIIKRMSFDFNKDCDNDLKALLEVLWFNSVETYATKKFYIQSLEYYINDIGFNRIIDNKIINENNEEININVDNSHKEYFNIENITYTQSENIRYAINNNSATYINKLKYKKYLFNRFLNMDNINFDDGDTCEIITFLFDDYCINNKPLIKNIQLEYSNNNHFDFYKQHTQELIKYNRDSHQIPEDCLKIKIINDITKILQIDNLYTTSKNNNNIINDVNLYDELTKYFEENKKSIDMTFKLGSIIQIHNKKKKDNEEDNKFNTSYYLNSILKKFNGSKYIPQKQTTRKINNITIRPYKYFDIIALSCCNTNNFNHDIIKTIKYYDDTDDGEIINEPCDD